MVGLKVKSPSSPREAQHQTSGAHIFHRHSSSLPRQPSPSPTPYRPPSSPLLIPYSLYVSPPLLPPSLLLLKPPVQRQCVDSCAGTCYYQSTINAAVSQGCNYLNRGQTVGSNRYPHVYNNYEGFDFAAASPYYEFPILHSFQPYTGGDPGPDRVVFTRGCSLQGLITHTGVCCGNFAQC